MQYISPQDLKSFGLIPEIIGRMPVLTYLNPLSREALLAILTEPKNALVRQYSKLLSFDDVELEFTPEALRRIAKLALERKSGARGLRAIIEGVMMDTMYELPSKEGVEKCIITEDAVLGKEKPQLVYLPSANVLPLESGESVTATVVTREFHEDEFLMMATKFGTVKRIPFIALKTNRKGGIRALTLEEGDQLVNVIRTNGNDNIILATAEGMAICFNENDVRPMGRDAAGVRGISLSDTDYVIGAQKAEEGKTLLTVTENGFGKRTELQEYLRTGPEGEKIPQQRGGKGLKNYNITPKTGFIAGCCLVGEQDDVMLIENSGVIIRVPAASINVYKRDVQGVIIMRIEEGNKLVSVERVAAEEEEVAE